MNESFVIIINNIFSLINNNHDQENLLPSQTAPESTSSHGSKGRKAA